MPADDLATFFDTLPSASHAGAVPAIRILWTVSSDAPAPAS
jgi:hypothetical protein